MERRDFRPGERMFIEGSPGEEAYIIESGRVEISKRVGGNETVVIDTSNKGDIVGEMALIDDGPRMATARVVEETRVIVVSKAEFARRLEGTDPVVRRVLQVLVERLRRQATENANRRAIIR